MASLGDGQTDFAALMADHIEGAVSIIEELQTLLEDHSRTYPNLGSAYPSTSGGQTTIKFSKREWFKIQHKTQRLMTELRNVRVAIDRDLLTLGM